MTYGYVRVHGTRYTAETIATETETTQVEGVVNEQSSSFSIVVSLTDDYDFALDIIAAALNNEREQLVEEVLPDDIQGQFDFETDEIFVEAGVEDPLVAYGLASRVAGQNQEADVLGETATCVEPILLDFAMQRRGADINGLDSAARTALIEHGFTDLTDGNAAYGDVDREAIRAEASQD